MSQPETNIDQVVAEMADLYGPPKRSGWVGQALARRLHGGAPR